jgi:hypothetical protein
MSTICSPSLSQFFAFNVSSMLIFVCRFFFWIALGNVDLRFSLLVRKANAKEEETR